MNPRLSLPDDLAKRRIRHWYAYSSRVLLLVYTMFSVAKFQFLERCSFLDPGYSMLDRTTGYIAKTDGRDRYESPMML